MSAHVSPMGRTYSASNCLSVIYGLSVASVAEERMQMLLKRFGATWEGIGRATEGGNPDSGVFWKFSCETDHGHALGARSPPISTFKHSRLSPTGSQRVFSRLTLDQGLIDRNAE